MAGRNGNYYGANEETVNLTDVTSSPENAIILQRLRDNDPGLTELGIGEQLINENEYDFNVGEGDDLGWLGYFIGGNTTLSYLNITYLPQEKWRSLAFIREIVSNRSIQKLVISSDLGEGFQSLGSILKSDTLVTLEFNPYGFNNFDTIELQCGRNIASMLGQQHQCNHLKSLVFENVCIRGEAMVEISTALSTHHPQLEKLDLYCDSRLGSVAVGSMLGGWRKPNLKDLSLWYGDGFDDEGLHALVAGMRNCNNLTRLSLGGNAITTNGCRLLCTLFQSDNFCLEYLHLKLINMNVYCAAALGTGLVNLISLKSLSFEESSVGDDALSALAPAIASLRLLETLNLADNSIGNDGTQALATGLANLNSLEELHLQYNSIGIEGAGALAAGLVNLRSLKKLYLSGNPIGDDGISVLAPAFASIQSLEELYLSDNSIGDEGLQAMVEGCCTDAHLCLKKLDLSGNPIGNEGISALGPALATLESLEYLNLSRYSFITDISISDDGVKVLVEGILHCSSLSELSLSGNVSITAAGLTSLSTLFQSDRCCLKKLSLRGIRIGNDGAVALADGLKGKKLIELHFSSSEAGLTSVGWSAFSKLLCDTSSVNNTYLSNHSIETIGNRYSTYLSNHTLERIGDRYRSEGIRGKIKQLLKLNKHPDEHVAIHKILKSHPDFDIEPFFEWKLKLLPLLVFWFERVITLVHVDDHKWISGESLEAIQRRKLSSMYKFIRGMPHLVPGGYHSRKNPIKFAFLKRKISNRCFSYLLNGIALRLCVKSAHTYRNA